MVDPTGKDVWCAIAQSLIVFGVCALLFGLKGEHCNGSRAQMNGQNSDNTVNVVVFICSQMAPVFWRLGRFVVMLAWLVFRGGRDALSGPRKVAAQPEPKAGRP